MIALALLSLTGHRASSGIKFKLGVRDSLDFNVIGAHEDDATEFEENIGGQFILFR